MRASGGRSLLVALAASFTASLATPAAAADAYIKSLENRLAALESEVFANQTDAKGKGNIDSTKIPTYVVPKSKYVTQMKLGGLLQWQSGYSWGSGFQNPGKGSYSTSEIRRARVNVSGTLTEDFRFSVEFEAVGSAGAQVGLGTAYLQFAASEFIQPKAGKFKPRFGYEEFTPSAKLLTVERSRISNAFATLELVGAAVEGRIGMLNYSAGIFNALPGGSGSKQDVNPFPSQGNQDYLYNSSVALDLEKIAGMPLEFRADYMNFSVDPTTLLSNGTANQPNRMNLHHNINVSAHAGLGPLDLITEWYYGFDSNAPQANLVKQGRGKEYAWAVTVEPSLFLIPDRLQFILRYEYGSAGFTTDGINQPFGTRVRYERALPGAGSGALEYFAIYSGLNYYLNGHDLKLMLGHYYSEQQGAVDGGKSNDRVAQTLYCGVSMMF